MKLKTLLLTAIGFSVMAIFTRAWLKTRHVRLSSAQSSHSQSAPGLIPGAPVSGPLVSGQVHGRPFQPDRCTLNLHGYLTLEQGFGMMPDLMVEIEFPEQAHALEAKASGESPWAGQSIRLPGEFYVPVVTVSWVEQRPCDDADKSRGNCPPGFTRRESFNGDYALDLEFGRQEGAWLPGRITLRLPDKAQTELKGNFTINPAGHHTIIAALDPRQDDAFGLIGAITQRLLERHLEDIHAGQPAVLQPGIKSTFLGHKGSANASYRVGGGPAKAIRADFVKDSSGWRLTEMVPQ